jgi:hypothetical protein
LRKRSYVFRPMRHRINSAGFPHSEIFGLKRACRSPKLIAACCVLHRLMMPRHPLIAVTGLCKHLIILGVYLTHLQIYLFTLQTSKLSKNEIRFDFITSPCDRLRILTDPVKMVGPDGLEPSTPRLSSACSNQLSYEPKKRDRVEPRL